MDIKRAKEEIIRAIEAYLLKDRYGEYRIPSVHQRPIFLLGAPGIGKTQIMQQIAAQLRIGLVAYTITHHTRQSAIGLPFLSEESYGGQDFTVTQYTLSEIVASIYQKIEQTGLKEGILFIDEINCVSETLAPAMLQFLQYKTFGNHPIPEGWIIVAAGNPPEYNKQVRDFDVVTLDRVKKIEVEPSLAVWKEYAWDVHIHPAILSYMEYRPDHFYKMETTVDGKFFATPRGWEDLSRMLLVYEELGREADRELIVQYIQHPDIAKDFAGYLSLFVKYQESYAIDEVFRGNISDLLLKKASHASFDERLSLIGLLLSRCDTGFRNYCQAEDYMEVLYPVIQDLKDDLPADTSALEDTLSVMAADRKRQQKAALLTPDQALSLRRAEEFLEKRIASVKGSAGLLTGEECFAQVKEAFTEETAAYDAAYQAAGEALEHAFDFLESAFGPGQEIVLFLTQLNQNRRCLRFLERYDCERYYQYNASLLFDDRRRELLNKLDLVL